MVPDAVPWPQLAEALNCFCHAHTGRGLIPQNLDYLGRKLLGIGAYKSPKATSCCVQWTLAYLATTRLDHGRISEITGYVNHHANRVYNVSLLALPILFLSCYPSLMQIIVVFWPLQAWESRNSGIFGCSNDLDTAIFLCMQHGR